MFTGLVLSVVNRMSWQTQDQNIGKGKLHTTADENWLQQRKQWPTIPKANSFHTVESLRRRTSCCCSQPVSRMLTTVLAWSTDFLTGAIMESHMLIGASLLALAKSINYIYNTLKSSPGNRLETDAKHFIDAPKDHDKDVTWKIRAENWTMNW